MERYQNKEIIKVIEKNKHLIKDELIREVMFDFWINDNKVYTFYCTPENLEEMVIGYSYTQGYIQSIDDLYSIKIDQENHQIFMRISNISKLKANQTIDKLAIKTDYLFYLIHQLQIQSHLFHRTGASHGVMLADETSILIFAEDVARHNALDKVIGKMLIDKLKPQNKIFVFSGRVAVDMLKKVKESHVKFIVAVGAPTYEAVLEAEKADITLCGFAKNNKMNIYAGSDWIE